MSAQAEAANPSPQTADENSTPETTTTQPEAAAGTETPAPASGTENHGAAEGASTADPGLKPDAPKAQAGQDDIDEYERMLSEALEPPGESGERKPETGESQAQAVAEGETDPAAAATDQTQTEEQVVDPAKAGEEAKIPERIRISSFTEEEQAVIHAATVLARTKKITFAEAFAVVSGTKPTGASPSQQAASAEQGSPQTTTVPQPPQVRDPAVIEAEIEALLVESETAGKALDTAAMAANMRKQRVLEKELRSAETAIAQFNSDRERAFVETTTRQNATAVELYPDVNVPDSPLAKRMTEIADAMERTGNELVYSPNAALKIAQMAANELGIAPKARTAAATKPASERPATAQTQISTVKPGAAVAAPAKVQPVQQRAVVPGKAPAVAPASGAARTTHNGSPAVDPGRIRTGDAQAYEDMLRSLQIEASE